VTTHGVWGRVKPFATSRASPTEEPPAMIHCHILWPLSRKDGQKCLGGRYPYIRRNLTLDRPLEETSSVTGHQVSSHSQLRQSCIHHHLDFIISSAHALHETRICMLETIYRQSHATRRSPRSGVSGASPDPLQLTRWYHRQIQLAPSNILTFAFWTGPGPRICCISPSDPFKTKQETSALASELLRLNHPTPLASRAWSRARHHKNKLYKTRISLIVYLTIKTSLEPRSARPS
jgi:hypothetical protein